jgi:hypothetical protein
MAAALKRPGNLIARQVISVHVVHRSPPLKATHQPARLPPLIGTGRRCDFRAMTTSPILPVVTGGAAGAGQAATGPCLFALVTALDRQGQRGGVSGAGFADLAPGEERFAKTVESLGLTRAIADLSVEGQRLPEMADGLLAAALPQLGKAQASQRPGLTRPVADLAAQAQGLPKMADGLHVMALPQLEFAEVAQHQGLTRPEASAAKERERPPQVSGSLLVTTLPQVNDPESVQLTGLSGVVADAQVDG